MCIKQCVFSENSAMGCFTQEWLNFGALRPRIATSLGASLKSGYIGALRARMATSLGASRKKCYIGALHAIVVTFLRLYQ